MYFGYFFSAFFLSIIITAIIYPIMVLLKVVDSPKGSDRKIHKKKIPLGGGLAIFLSFFIILALTYRFDNIFGDAISFKNILGLFVGGFILMIGGFLDDKYNLTPKQQIIFPIFSALTIIVAGIGPNTITNPLGGTIDLSFLKIEIVGMGNWVVLADFMVFFWLLGMMYTTKFLDGLDGLVTGIVGIGALMIFILSLRELAPQPEVATMSIIFAGACFGFLIWNWNPAKIFLGEGGSLFTGFMLGSLAIISGGKVATTLLVIGLPMLDVIRVIILRIKNKKPIYLGDQEHLHFKLLKSGLNQRQAVLIMYAISFSFGFTTLFLQSSQKIIALLFLFILMLLIGFWLSLKEKKH